MLNSNLKDYMSCFSIDEDKLKITPKRREKWVAASTVLVQYGRFVKLRPTQHRFGGISKSKAEVNEWEEEREMSKRVELIKE